MGGSLEATRRYVFVGTYACRVREALQAVGCLAFGGRLKLRM
jgi:hypothetical protein